MSGTIIAKISFESGDYRTYGELPSVGSRAPDIMLVNTKLQNVSLANWIGMRKIMNIFVSIDTSICARSVIEFDSRVPGVEAVASGVVS